MEWPLRERRAVALRALRVVHDAFGKSKSPRWRLPAAAPCVHPRSGYPGQFVRLLGRTHGRAPGSVRRWLTRRASSPLSGGPRSLPDPSWDAVPCPRRRWVRTLCCMPWGRGLGCGETAARPSGHALWRNGRWAHSCASAAVWRARRGGCFRHEPAAGWQCGRRGRAVASGRPGQQRCPVPSVRIRDEAVAAAEQAYRAVLARRLCYWQWVSGSRGDSSNRTEAAVLPKWFSRNLAGSRPPTFRRLSPSQAPTKAGRMVSIWVCLGG